MAITPTAAQNSILMLNVAMFGQAAGTTVMAAALPTFKDGNTYAQTLVTSSDAYKILSPEQAFTKVINNLSVGTGVTAADVEALAKGMVAFVDAGLTVGATINLLTVFLYNNAGKLTNVWNSTSSQLFNKTAAASIYTLDQNNAASSTSAIANVTDQTTSTLTVYPDTLTGNLFNAPQAYTPGGNDLINTLQNDDVLTGTTGTTDVLNATLGNTNDNGAVLITPTLTGIEIINAKFDNTAANMTLDLQDSTGVTNINITRIAEGRNATVQNIADAGATNLSVANSQSPNNNVFFTYLNSALSGTADAGKLALSNVKTGGITVQSNDGTVGFETLAVSSNGADNFVGVLTAQDVKTLTIDGSKKLTLGTPSTTVNALIANNVEATRYAAGLANMGGSLTKIDASALTAVLDITLGAEMNAGLDGTSGLPCNVTVTGGSANDIFRLSNGTNLDVTDSIIGGAAAGTDTNTLVLLGNNAINGTVTKVQALEIRTGHDALAAADAVAVDASKIVDLATTYIRNEGQVFNAATNRWESNAEAATVTLTKLTAAADQAVTIAHGTTGNSALANLGVSLSLATATGTTDKAAITIVDGINTDPVFNFSLVTPATEQLQITDSDTESNTLYLSGVASYAGAASAITLLGGAAGKYFNLDTNAGNSAAAAAGRGGYGYATDGSAGDNTTALAALDTAGSFTVAAGTMRRDAAVSTAFTANLAVAGDRILAENFVGTTYAGDIIARFGDITRADGVSSMSITGGTGNDTFIFDAITIENAGYTSGDTVKGSTGTDTLLIDGDTTLLAGTPRITHNTSEWDNTTGIDILRFGNNQGVANVGNAAFTAGAAGAEGTGGILAAGGAYYAHIDNDFIGQTDAGNRLTVINNDGDRATQGESDLVLDITGLSALKWVTYVGANGNGGAGHASTRIILDDISANQNQILNGGDITGATGGVIGNTNIYNVLNTANVSINDLAQTSNFGKIAFTNDQAVAQTLTLTLNNTVVEAMVDSSNTATTAALQEILFVAGVDNGVVASALNIDARQVTGFHGLNITGSNVAGTGNDILRLDANVGGTADTINLGATSLGDRINWTGTATTVAISHAGNTSAFTVGATTTTHGTTGVDYSDISGLTYTTSTLTGAATADTLVGGAGADVITGAAGLDVMTGGAGANVFVFSTASTGTPSAVAFDTITDWRTSTGSNGTIDFGATALAVGTQTNAAGVGVATVGAAGLLAFNAADTTLAQHIVAAEAALSGGAAARSVIWVEGADAYLWIDDGAAGVGATDVLIKLTGVAVTAAGLTFAGGDITAIA